MGAWIPTAGRPPRRVRWSRRIAGVLGTAALLAVAVAIAVMIIPSSDSGPETPAVSVPTPTPSPAAQDKAKQRPALTPAQKRARAAAVQTLANEGYEPVRLSDYDPRHVLRVLIGHPTGDSQGPRRAFFFAGGRYVGSDSTEPSNGLKVARSGKRWVTLTYGVYASTDQACCPSGHTKVRFALSNGALSAVGGTIPPATERIAVG